MVGVVSPPVEGVASLCHMSVLCGVALQEEVTAVCGEDDHASYQEMLDSLRAQIDSTSE